MMEYDSCETVGGHYTTDMDDDSVLVPLVPTPPRAAAARPKSPKTPQAQIVKNNFRATYRVSGRKQSQRAYRPAFVSPELLRDGKHGLFTHFEDRRARGEPIQPPSTSPKAGECFVRSVSHHPSPAARVRKLRVLSKFHDTSARAYYDTPNKPSLDPAPPAASSTSPDRKDERREQRVAAQRRPRTLPEEDGATERQESARSASPSHSSRRKVRGRLAFPLAASATPDRPSPGGSGPEADDDKEAKLLKKSSPTSVIDGTSTLCCELCGQGVDDRALSRICSVAIPYLQNRGRYVSAATEADILRPPVQVPLAIIDSDPNKEEEGSECSQEDSPHRVAAHGPVHRVRNKAQKKVWKSIARGSHGLAPPLGPSSALSPAPTSMIHQDLTRKLAYTPVKKLIYSQVKQANCLDVNAATFLFASQMKLTLNGV